MNLYLKLALILFGLAYLISPVDVIPDLLLPWVGWIDDGVVLWSVYYLIRYGELPWFLFRKNRGRPKPGPAAGLGPDPRPKHKTRHGRRSGFGPDTGKAAGPRTNPGSFEKKGAASRPGPDLSAPKSPHEVLGVPAQASWEQIQAAYKKKIKQYHPDKLSHLGEEFSSLANEKFLEIQAAYNHLKQIRGKR